MKDRETGLRHYLNFIGTNSNVYFLANFIVDYGLYLIPCYGFIMFAFIADLHAFIDALSDYILVMMAFGACLATCTYLFGFLFAKSQTAFRIVSVVYIFIGFYLPFILKTVVFYSFGCRAY